MMTYYMLHINRMWVAVNATGKSERAKRERAKIVMHKMGYMTSLIGVRVVILARRFCSITMGAQQGQDPCALVYDFLLFGFA